MDKMFGGRNRFWDQGGHQDKYGLYPHDLTPYTKQNLLDDVDMNPDLFPQLFRAAEVAVKWNKEAIRILTAELEIQQLGGLDLDERYQEILENEIGNLEDSLEEISDSSNDLRRVYILANPVPEAAVVIDKNLEIPGLQKLLEEVRRVFVLDHNLQGIDIVTYVEMAQYNEKDRLTYFEINVHVPKSQAPFSYLEAFGSHSVQQAEPVIKNDRLWLSISGETEFYWDAGMEIFVLKSDGDDDLEEV
jgi:hypothetical protein